MKPSGIAEGKATARFAVTYEFPIPWLDRLVDAAIPTIAYWVHQVSKVGPRPWSIATGTLSIKAEGGEFSFDLEGAKLALAFMAAERPITFARLVKGGFAADDADLFVQYAAFGEERYG